MRRSDILLFGTMIASLIVACISLITGWDSSWIGYWWLVPLLPVAIAKMLFPKSKFVAWWSVYVWGSQAEAE